MGVVYGCGAVVGVLGVGGVGMELGGQGVKQASLGLEQQAER